MCAVIAVFRACVQRILAEATGHRVQGQRTERYQTCHVYRENPHNGRSFGAGADFRMVTTRTTAGHLTGIAILSATWIGLYYWFPMHDGRPKSTDPIAPLAATYGPHRNSEHFEEWIVRDHFRDQRGGIFVDVGAHHYRSASNTYFLERELGWSGIAVEPQTQFEADYALHRPGTKFRPFFVSDVSDARATLYMDSKNPLIASGEKSFTERVGSGSITTTEVPTITLTDLLDREGVTRVDFLTMDIELWEPKALAGFAIARFRPALVCIEDHEPVRQQILDYFQKSGYVFVGKYMRMDEHNLWFEPAAR
jgi:FkbM family methyltransferase